MTIFIARYRSPFSVHMHLASNLLCPQRVKRPASAAALYLACEVDVPAREERLLLSAQNESSISTPFLVVVVFWLSVLFVSFGLFAPRNPTAIVTLLVAAISVAGALYLIFELDHPFSGLMQISSAPLRSALSVLGK